jgi:phosphoribosylaminoimidazole-succinocarboxamide synthase
MSAVVWETNFPGMKLLSRGKVRDLYEIGNDLLLVATDRLSAFDVVLPTPIPDKGKVLTQLSLFWFETLRDVVPNHVLSASEFPEPAAAFSQQLAGRAMLCRRSRLRLEGLSRDRESLRHQFASGPARVRPPARASFHPVH